MKSFLKRIAHMYSKMKFREFGAGSLICTRGAIIVTPARVTVGKNVFVGPKSYISAEVVFEDNVMIGPGLTVIGGNHTFGVVGKLNRFLKPEQRKDGSKSEMILFGNDAWVGANVTVLPGVKIGEGAVVGAGSVVTKNLGAYTLNVGNPCKKIRNIFSDNEEIAHRSAIAKNGYTD